MDALAYGYTCQYVAGVKQRVNDDDTPIVLACAIDIGTILIVLCRDHY